MIELPCCPCIQAIAPLPVFLSSQSFCPGPPSLHSLLYLIYGDEAEFNLPERMTSELKAQLDSYEDVHAVSSCSEQLRE